MLAYKVVRRSLYGNFASCIVRGVGEVTYRIGKKAKAPQWLADQGYHLLVFESFAAASKWMTRASTSTILIVRINKKDIIPSIPPPLLPPTGVWIVKLGSASGEVWPEGTLMVKELIVLGELK